MVIALVDVAVSLASLNPEYIGHIPWHLSDVH